MKKKGFTLIELLAVIIILAVIALIATPIVLNVIDNAKKSAAEESVRGYATAIKYARMDYLFEHDGAEPANIEALGDSGNLSKYYEGSEVTCTSSELNGGSPVLKGCTVTNYSSTVKFDYANGKVTDHAE